MNLYGMILRKDQTQSKSISFKKYDGKPAERSNKESDDTGREVDGSLQ